MIWHPIATAPKDGRRILLYYAERLPFYSVGWWAAEIDSSEGYWSCQAEYVRGARWHRVNHPTHWAELTEPANETT